MAYSVNASSDTIKIDVTVIKASNQGDQIDSSLSKIKSQLKRLNYTNYSLISQNSKTGTPRGELIFKLPDGDTMRVVLIDVEDGSIKLLVSIEKAGLKTNFKIVNNGTVIVGGNAYQDGYMVIAITASY